MAGAGAGGVLGRIRDSRGGHRTATGVVSCAIASNLSSARSDVESMVMGILWLLSRFRAKGWRSVWRIFPEFFLRERLGAWPKEIHRFSCPPFRPGCNPDGDFHGLALALWQCSTSLRMGQPVCTFFGGHYHYGPP